MPLTQAEYCHQKALECEDEAKKAGSPGRAEAWLKMAQQWALASGPNRTFQALKSGHQRIYPAVALGH
jgi:hypothetical protein